MSNPNISIVEYTEPLKLVIIGDSSAGKTCIVLRYTEDRFNFDHLSTMGVDYHHKDIIIEDKSVKVQIWDTAGQERFRSIAKNYIKGAQGILLVYDVTNESTFKGLIIWIEQLKDIILPNTRIMILGNKIDDIKNRKITFEQGKEVAEKYNCQFYETSAKDNTNIEIAFLELTKVVYKESVKSAQLEEETRQKIQLSKQQAAAAKKSPCCLESKK